jgi:hypothetical protein
MASEPVFTNFYGAGATQNLTDLVIKKADLQAPVGLVPSYEFTPAEINRPEQLFTAILHRAQRNQDVSPDAQVRITPWTKEFSEEFGKPQIVFRCQVILRIDEPINNLLPNPNLV